MGEVAVSQVEREDSHHVAHAGAGQAEGKGATAEGGLVADPLSESRRGEDNREDKDQTEAGTPEKSAHTSLSMIEQPRRAEPCKRHCATHPGHLQRRPREKRARMDRRRIRLRRLAATDAQLF